MKRLFNIKKNNNTIDLSDSCIVENNMLASYPLSSEIYKICFTCLKFPNKKYSLFVSYDELIEEEDIENLKTQLGIEVCGDGSLIEIISHENDFSMQFDQENSLFIETDFSRNGLLFFHKNSAS
ncbi:MAG: hypothetical protein QM535_03370 [Limnohabitans sp.]|nr:hypothetical protein [Limnohabitans sp.]